MRGTWSYKVRAMGSEADGRAGEGGMREGGFGREKRTKLGEMRKRTWKRRRKRQKSWLVGMESASAMECRCQCQWAVDSGRTVDSGYRQWERFPGGRWLGGVRNLEVDPPQ